MGDQRLDDLGRRIQAALIKHGVTDEQRQRVRFRPFFERFRESMAQLGEAASRYTYLPAMDARGRNARRPKKYVKIVRKDGRTAITVDGGELANVAGFKIMQQAGSLPYIKLKIYMDDFTMEQFE